MSKLIQGVKFTRLGEMNAAARQAGKDGPFPLPS
jgi:hypothetical protein